VTRVTGAPVGGVSSENSVLRLDFGYFVRPAEETGSTAPRVEPVLGYVVQHPKGTVLLDSGMGSHPDVDDHYRPRRVALPDALHAAGLAVEDLTVVTNCHLHFGHCGGNPSLTGLPIVVQEVELAAAHLPDYTLPELVDAPGSPTRRPPATSRSSPESRSSRLLGTRTATSQSSSAEATAVSSCSPGSPTTRPRPTAPTHWPSAHPTTAIRLPYRRRRRG